MAMFFNKGFNGVKCKTMLKLTIPRIKLLRNRRKIQLEQMRKDIAKLIENGQEATARIRVEHIVREENMMAAQEILELFCELVSVRLPIIETQRECPLDLKEAISSICFAAPRCADLPELQQVQMLFSMKYGKDFVAAAAELMPDCGVNRQIIELLSIRAPSVEVKMKLLKDIAEKHGLDWDPSASEAELLKPHEDLLNGPDHFTNGSTMRLPTEKHDNSSSTSHVNEYVGSDSDAELDSLDLPEVPRETIRTISDVPSAPGIVSHVPPSQPHDFGPHVPSPKPEVNSNASGDGNKQFLPFVIPPSSTFPAPDGESESAISPPLTHHLETPNFGEPTEASLSYSENISREDSKSLPHLPTDSVFSSHLNQSEPSSLISPSISPTKQSEPVNSPPPSTFTTSYQNDNSAAPTFSRTRSEINTDLQDVLAAAMAAAETAERAAAAARAAASLAEVKIADFVTKEKKTASGRPDAELQSPDSHRLPNSLGNPIFDHQDSFNRAVEVTSVMETKSTGFEDSPQSVHAPQRLPSLEEDPYFSYPNLFSPKDVDGKSGTEGPSSNSHNG